jgi:ankyrin repeat protein
VIEFLLSQGAMLDAKNRNHDTPLKAAVSGGHEKVTQLLLEQGADPNATSQFLPEENNLHIAVR